MSVVPLTRARAVARFLVMMGVLGVPANILAQSSASAQAPSPGAGNATTPQPPPTVTPQQMDRIRRSLNQPAGLNLDDRQLRFYLEIVARQPTFAEYTKGYDFVNGPTKRGNPMSHQEFVRMVTPQEMFSTAGITPLDQLQFAFTNWVGQSLIRKALEELKQAKTDREVQELRDRIDRELTALTGGRGN